MPPAPADAIRIRGRHPRMGALALALVLLSLAASLIVPVVLQQRIDAIRAEVDGRADPARTHVTGIQYALAREMSSLRGYLITADSAFLARYAEASRQEAQAHAALQPLARALDGAVFERFVVLRTLSEQWHQEVTLDELSRGRQASPAAFARLATEEELFERALATARDLDAELARATRERTLQVQRLERQRLAVTGALVLLAFASSLVVALLGRQVGRLALEAERQRVTAVRALGDTQRALASRYRLMRGVTHDIKNPLGAADGYAELLLMGLHGELAPRQRHAATRIRGCIADALGIIHDLLELSRAESGSLPVEPRDCDLVALVQEIADGYRAAAGAAGCELRVDAAGPVRVSTDPARVRQVLGNLVSNAIKYGRGSERVVLSVESAAPDARRGDWMVVRVADAGPGIPPAALARLFEEFYRAEGTAAVEGHGLGLSVARRVADLLGGDLTAESEVGRGSVFTLWLPAGAPLPGAPLPLTRGKQHL